jgi:hypothetical protein
VIESLAGFGSFDINEAHHKDLVEAFDIDASVQTKMVS